MNGRGDVTNKDVSYWHCVCLKIRQLAEGWPEHLGAAEDIRCLGTRRLELGGQQGQHQWIL